jgi:hypothetical protein
MGPARLGTVQRRFALPPAWSIRCSSRWRGDYAAALKRVEEVHGAGVAELRKSKRGGLAWS